MSTNICTYKNKQMLTLSCFHCQTKLEEKKTKQQRIDNDQKVCPCICQSCTQKGYYIKTKKNGMFTIKKQKLSCTCDIPQTYMVKCFHCRTEWEKEKDFFKESKIVLYIHQALPSLFHRHVYARHVSKKDITFMQMP